MSHSENLRLTQRGTYLSLIVYVILSTVKYVTSLAFNSAAVRADALDNMTDIIVSLTIAIGLRISVKPVDQDHPYGHLESESISSLLVSFVIMFVGIQVVIQNAPRLFKEDDVVPSAMTVIVNLISGLVMLIVFAVSRKLAERTKSSPLNSAAKDNLSDSLVSIGTAIGLIFTQIGFLIVNIILVTLLGLPIVYTGFDVFREAIFVLSGGFNEAELEAYRGDILGVNEIQEVKSIKGRYHGSSVFIDVTIVVDVNLPLVEAHQICGGVEYRLHRRGISSVYVHPEPGHL